MKYPHLTISRAWWSNTKDDFGNFRYGLEYGDGKRPTWALEKSLDAVEQAAHKLAADNNVKAELIDFAGRSHQYQLDAEQRLIEQQQRKEQSEKILNAVRGIGKMPAPTAFEPLVFSENVCAIPTIGGIFADLPLSGETESRFPESVRLPVTLAAEKARRWVVVCYNGQGVAMTIQEAYERGLREEPNWYPNIDGVPTVPRRRDFAAVGL